MKLRWGIGLGLLAVAAVGCDVSVCTNETVDGQCFDGPDFDFDAGPRIDASTDSGAPADGAVSPDSAVLVDGAVADGGTTGIDGGVADAGAGPALLTIEDFCDAEYKTAKAWRDRLEQCCPRSKEVTEASELLLAHSFFYGLDGMGKDSVARCIDGLKASAANLTYVAAAAPACAAAYNAQFTDPAVPASCPAEGFAVETLESSIGHMAASLNQLPECRAAIVGKIAPDAACGNSFECQSGLRCLTIPGGGAKSCRPPLDRGNPCTVTSECADGLVCMGLASGSGGRVCYAKTEPLEVNSACDEAGPAGGSTECRSGLICVNNKCSAPQATLICKQ